MDRIRKVAIIGNGGGGKTTLSKRLAASLDIPLTHVDKIQYIEFTVRPKEETQKILDEIASSDEWLIDGFGPMGCIEKRFLKADVIVYVDFPLWRHYWWCTKRQWNNFRNGIDGEAEGNPADLRGTFKLFKILWMVHTKLRPKFFSFFAENNLNDKIVWIKSLDDWSRLYNEGIQ